MKHNFCNKFLFAITTFCFFSSIVNCQDLSNVKQYSKYITHCNSRTKTANKKIGEANKKYLKKYFKTENKLNKKLCKSNPNLADYLFSYSNNPIYFHQKDTAISYFLNQRSTAKEYSASFDTLKSSVEFIKANKDRYLIDSLGLIETMTNTLKLDQDLLHSDKLQNVFREKKLIMKELSESHPELRDEFKEFDKINYYYHEQISEYQNMFGDLSNIDEKVLKILKGNSEFKKLLSGNGQLSAFSTIPQDWGNNIEGLQTIVETKGFMNTSVADLGSEAKNIVEKNMKPMMISMEKLKSGSYGNVSNAGDIPSFKPSALKTKPFVDRLSLGYNFQLNQSNYGFPATATTGLQVDYKLTSQIKPGIGVSYILGMGSGWDNINFSQQGIGLRSFVDYKISNILYISCGYERNSLPPSNQKKELGIKNWNWREIALGGIKLKYNTKVKLIPTMCFQYDFLHDEYNPPSPAFVYRVGWEFGK